MDVRRVRYDHDPDVIQPVAHHAAAAAAAAAGVAQEAIAAAAPPLAAHGLPAVEYLLSEEGRQEPAYAALSSWLTTGCHISATTAGRALRCAAERGDVRVIEFLIESGKLSKCTVGKSLEELAARTHLAVTAALMTIGRLDKAHTDRAIIEAIRLDRMDLYDFMRDRQITLSSASLPIGLTSAAHKTNLEVLRHLASMVRSEIHLNSLSSALSSVALKGSIACTRLILELDHPIKQDFLDLSLEFACGQGNLELVQLMMSSSKVIHEQGINKGLRKAASERRIDVLRYLLDERRPVISMEGIMIASETAGLHGHLDVVRMLEDYMIVNYVRDRSSSIRAAVRQAWKGTLEALLAGGPIGALFKCYTMHLTQDEEIKLMLQQTPTILDSHYARVVPSIATLDRAALRSHPKRFLYYVNLIGLPLKVVFSHHLAAQDLGGLMKQFVAEVGQGLIEQGVFHRTDSGLLLCENAHEARLITMLGNFYSQLLERNASLDDKLLIGPIVHRRFFHFIQIAAASISQQRMLEETADLLAEIHPEQIILRQMMFDPTPEQKAIFRQMMLCQPGREVAEARQIIESYLRAAHAFLKGASPQLKAKIDSNPIRALLSIQGHEVTQERLLDALTPAEETPLLLARIDWLREKIILSDELFLEKFVFAVTSKRALAMADQITIAQSAMPDRFFFRTCLNTLELPTAPMDKEEFFQAIDTCLDLDFNHI